MAEPVEAPLSVVFSSIPGTQGQVTAWEDPVQVDMWARADRIRLQGRSVDGGWPGWLRPLSTAWRPLFLTGNSLERRPAISVTKWRARGAAQTLWSLHTIAPVLEPSFAPFLRLGLLQLFDPSRLELLSSRSLRNGTPDPAACCGRAGWCLQPCEAFLLSAPPLEDTA